MSKRGEPISKVPTVTSDGRPFRSSNDFIGDVIGNPAVDGKNWVPDNDFGNDDLATLTYF